MSEFENNTPAPEDKITSAEAAKPAEDVKPAAPKKKSKKKIIIAICVIASALPVLFLIFVILLVLLLRGCASSFFSDESNVDVEQSHVEIVLPDTSVPDTDVPDDWYDGESNTAGTPSEDNNSNEENNNRPAEDSKEPEHVHNYGEWVVVTAATETTVGMQERTCSCGHKETAAIPVLEHTHTFSTGWVSNSSSHWNSCSCGEKANVSAHTFGSWKTVKTATCTKSGEKKRTCSACGYAETQTVSPSSHSYSQGSCAYCGKLQSEGLSIGIETVNGKKVAIVYSVGTCKDSNIYIPAKYNGVTVTTIGHAAFRKCTFITSITIPSSVTAIENDAFTGCTGLTRAVFADASGWYITTTEGASSGSNLTISDQSKAAEYLKTYRHYYWYKK